nr:MAG TPA: Nucleotide modification associated domain 1 [Caudoviricetes sp.]
MIKKEDIKVGLVFTLCERRGKDERGWILHSIASGGFDVLLKDKVDLPVLFKIVDIKDNRVTIETEREFFVMGNSHNTIFGKLEEQWTTTIFCFGIEEFNRIITETGKKWLSMEEIINLRNCANNLSEETVNKLNGVRDMSQDVMLFNRITGEMQETYIKKNHDYGNAFSEMYDELGINYGYGKIREKVNRIKTLKDGDAMVENEPLEDALLDCANYCILTLMEYKKHKEHGKD